MNIVTCTLAKVWTSAIYNADIFVWISIWTCSCVFTWIWICSCNYILICICIINHGISISDRYLSLYIVLSCTCSAFQKTLNYGLFNWARSCWLPTIGCKSKLTDTCTALQVLPLLPGPIYLMTPRKCSVLGVNCEALPCQVNFLTDEAGECGKSANDVFTTFWRHTGSVRSWRSPTQLTAPAKTKRGAWCSTWRGGPSQTVTSITPSSFLD